MKIKRKTKVAALIVLLLAILPSYVRAYTIDGPSMSPTFWLKDKVVAIQAAYDLRFPYTETSMLANLVLEEQLDGNSHLITYAKCDQSIQLWSRVSADGSILHSR